VETESFLLSFTFSEAFTEASFSFVKLVSETVCCYSFDFCLLDVHAEIRNMIKMVISFFMVEI